MPLSPINRLNTALTIDTAISDTRPRVEWIGDKVGAGFTGHQRLSLSEKDRLALVGCDDGLVLIPPLRQKPGSRPMFNVELDDLRSVWIGSEIGNVVAEVVQQI